MQIKKTVYLIRHGESEDNTAPVFQSYDSPLSSNGRSQALKVAKRATELDFETLISSPQPRAEQTTQTIAETTGKAYEISPLFIERVKPTSVGGKSWSDDEATKIWRAWEKSLTTPGLKVQDGEGFDDIVNRADRALAFLEHRPEQSFLVVSHGHFIRTIIARIILGPDLTGLTLKRFYELVQIENTAITTLDFSDAFEQGFLWRLRSLNDHAHFAD